MLQTGCVQSQSSGKDTSRLPHNPKIVLIGIDGASWRVLRPLLQAGELPNFQQLLDEGSGGVLRSIVPMKSPALWTTIATGKKRESHGIKGFQVGDRLVNATDRKLSTMWDWVNASQRTVGIAGWWATWPAPKVNGWIVSDLAVNSRWQSWSTGVQMSDIVYPASLSDTVFNNQVNSDDVTRQELARIVKLKDPEWQEYKDAQKPVFAHWLSVLKYAYSNQRSYENIVLHMLENQQQPDFLALFLVATDPISHTFWHFYEPGKFKKKITERTRRLGQAIPNIYRHNDQFIGKIRDKVDPETIFVIISDHGFMASGMLPKQISRQKYTELKSAANPKDVVAIGQSGKHDRDGIIVVSGPGIKQGLHMRASILDVAPTVMGILGLPTPTGLDGQAISGLFESGMQRTRNVRLPDKNNKPQVMRRPVDDRGLRDRLKSLGYMQ